MTEQESPQIQQPAQQQKKSGGFFWEIVKFTIFAAIIVFPIRFFIAQPFVVSGASMDPTFKNGEYLIVDQISYKIEAPHREDVIVFRYPNDKTKFFIKRIIGLPGETVEIRGGTVHIKNPAHPDGEVLVENYIAPEHQKQDTVTMTLKDNEYFVMGDNRSGSSDSRMWGPVGTDLIMGRPFVRLLPLSRIDLFPGTDRNDQQ